MRDATLKGRVEGAAEPGGMKRTPVRVRQEGLGKGVQQPWEFGGRVWGLGVPGETTVLKNSKPLWSGTVKINY